MKINPNITTWNQLNPFHIELIKAPNVFQCFFVKGIGNRSVAHRTSRQSSRAQYIADTAQDYPTKRPRTSQEGLVKIKKYK
ncbi:hypothetical protein O3G_MSEX001218 [Manduca sexta]|uniref:Uncharacterized protein n=1 Tax=Manduca sexta TaxID=7130 RepID=A0A922C8X6_MANSE|nr:hypothetical protein O3G_MSEX001218 [Manduca sexta]